MVNGPQDHDVRLMGDICEANVELEPENDEKLGREYDDLVVEHVGHGVDVRVVEDVVQDVPHDANIRMV